MKKRMKRKKVWRDTTRAEADYDNSYDNRSLYASLWNQG